MEKTMRIQKGDFKPLMDEKTQKSLIQHDIIVNRVSTQIEYKDGAKIEKRVITPVNITKKINETKKLLKNYTAEEKIAFFDELAKVK